MNNVTTTTHEVCVEGMAELVEKVQALEAAVAEANRLAGEIGGMMAKFTITLKTVTDDPRN